MPKSPELKKVAPGATLLEGAFSDLGSSPQSWRAADKATGQKKRDPQAAKHHQSARSANLSPEQRISRYLERLENVLSLTASKEVAPHSRLQQRLIKSAVLDISNHNLVEKLARGLFLSERRIALERGYAAQTQAVEFEAVQQDYTKLIHEKHAQQVSSLSLWTSYLLKNDAQHPAWFRYMAIRSVLKMGDFDRDAPKYGKRTRDTIAAFPELNSEALGLVLRILSDPTDEAIRTVILQNEDLVDSFRKAIASKSFSALYAVSLVACNQTLDRSRLEGEWRTYDQGSDYTILEGDLSGKATGWCTATGSAQEHLQGGDFYVYYTKDKNEEYSIPRVAIRMEDERIAEIRGIAPKQELEPEFVDIVEEKGKTLPGYEQFQKASADMKRLTEIDKRCFIRDEEGNIRDTLVPAPPLSREELRFLYEVDSKISSFGYEKDPRIKQLCDSRPNKREDYSLIYDVPLEQVVVRKEDISSSTRVYIGDLGPDDYQILNERSEPLVIAGYANFEGCTSLTTIPEGCVFNGDGMFNGCTSLTTIPKGVVFNSSANFSGCTSLTTIPEGCVFNGYANFVGCTSLTTIPEGVVFYESVNFSGCTSLTTIPEGCVFNGDGSFNGCTSLTTIPKGVVFNSSAIFSGCTSLTTIPEGCVFNGYANFVGCTSLTTIPEGVVFNSSTIFSDCTSLTTIPKGVVFNWHANFEGCTSLTTIPEGVVFKGEANFAGCTSLTTIAKGVVFYESVNFSGCTSLTTIPEGVVFNWYANFEGCASLSTIPEGVVFNGNADFVDCTSLTTIAKGVEFKGLHAYFVNCTSLTTIAKGVVFKGHAYFEGCTSLTTIPEGVVFNRYAKFTRCTSLTTIPEGVVFNGNADFMGCASLTTIAKGVVFKGNADFAGCTSLTTIAKGVVFNSSAIFSGCTSLTTIPEGVVFKGNADFMNCTSLRTIGSGTEFHVGVNVKDCPSLVSDPTDFIVKPSMKDPPDA